MMSGLNTTTYANSRRVIHQPRRAFTLIELMVSVALALILILGINQVFKISSDTIRASNALSSNTRDWRAVQGVLTKDFQSAIPYGTPFVTLDSQQVFAFRNKTDEASDRDGNPATFDNTGTGTTPEPAVLATSYGPRSHRADILNFFAADIFRRQTGDGGSFQSSTSASEAMIHYGHLLLPARNSTATFFAPGDTTPGNTDNRYAADWVLGRVAILLAETPPSGDRYYSRANPVDVEDLSPLKFSTPAVDGYPINASRYDLAATSIASFRQLIEANIVAHPYPNDTWWKGGGPQNLNGNFNFRFLCNPFLTRPADSAKVAQMAPYFVGGCTQFMVEFAGDYISQDGTTGQMLGNGPDGVVDFVAQQVGAKYVKTIRWYGAPRDTASDVTPNPDPAKDFRGRPDGVIDPKFDVVPVASLRGGPSSFEKVTPTATNPRYFCAWGPNELVESGLNGRPQLFRITLTIDDPAGNLTDGQNYEYVVKLGL